MKIIFIRHCDPDYEKDSLTDRGFIEAEALGEYYKDLNIKDIYCSPFGRAIETAKYLLKYNKKTSFDDVEIIKDFREFNYRIKLPYKENANAWDLLPTFLGENKDLYDLDNWMNNKYYQSGNIKEHYEDVCKALETILNKHGYYKNKDRYFDVKENNKDTIVIVAHLGLIAACLSYLLNTPFVTFSQNSCLVPSSVVKVVTEERRKGIAQFRMLQFGNIEHLTTKNIEPSFAARFCEIYEDDSRHD
ncbi:MAG: histidine phosphatase family protein [Candidatus Onthovivens sp.]|nr:histidine phosphatase family protein [Candidatus Onthovivens sp.]